MKFLSSLISFSVYTLYGIVEPEPEPTPKGPIAVIVITLSTITVGIVAGIIVLLNHFFKKKNNQEQRVDESPKRTKTKKNQAQVLYGPPRMFEPPEDLYGCPRPEEEPEELEDK